MRLVLGEWALGFSLMWAKVWEDQKIREATFQAGPEDAPRGCVRFMPLNSGLLALRRKAQRKALFSIIKHKMETPH